MPNVLVLGSTGYLGLTLSLALLRTGNYTVYGLARSNAKARLLTRNEIIPLVGDVSDPSVITSAISIHAIDVVVDTTSAYEHAATLLAAVVEAGKARAEALEKEGAVGPKLAFVYSSGTWVHGSPSRRVSDLEPAGTSLAADKPANAVAWRTGYEQQILAARDVLDVAIVRPAVIIGRGSWILNAWLTPLLEAKKSGSLDKVSIAVDKKARVGIVHVDDVAEGYVKVIERINGSLGSWPVFDLTAETVSAVEFLEGAKDVVGVKAELDFVGAGGDAFMEAMSLVTKNDSGRARSILGWEANRMDAVQSLEVYVKAWEASQEEN